MKNVFRYIVSLFTKYEYPPHINQLFYRWLVDEEHAKEKDEALQELWVEAQNKGEIPDLEKSFNRWKQNNGIISNPLPEKRKTKHFLRFWQSAAAILLIISVSSIYMATQIYKSETEWVQLFSSVTQSTKMYVLPDGSKVQMNSKSTLLYPKQFTGKNRSVYLIGEANFKVKPDKKHPFIVKTNDFQVTALGTEFNVSTYAEDPDISATLISGSVLVEYDNLQKRTLLKPKEQFSYNKESRHGIVTHPLMEDVTAWQRGELVFQQMTVTDIITILERKYNYQFIYSLHSLSKDRFSFRFKDQAPLSEVMDVIVDVVGNLSFKLEEDKCYIISK